jgi:hypothetical protein
MKAEVQVIVVELVAPELVQVVAQPAQSAQVVEVVAQPARVMSEPA